MAGVFASRWCGSAYVKGNRDNSSFPNRFGEVILRAAEQLAGFFLEGLSSPEYFRNSPIDMIWLPSMVRGHPLTIPAIIMMNAKLLSGISILIKEGRVASGSRS